MTVVVKALLGDAQQPYKLLREGFPMHLSKYRRIVIFDDGETVSMRIYEIHNPDPVVEIELTDQELVSKSIEMLEARRRRDNKKLMKEMQCD